MNGQRIARLLDARPFKPFVVYTNSPDEGTFIDDPESAKIEDDGETLVVAPQPARGERWTKLIDIRLVVIVAVQPDKPDRE